MRFTAKDKDIEKAMRFDIHSKDFKNA